MLTKQQADAVDAAMLAQELYIKARTNVSISGLQQRIAELEAKLAARDEALKVAREALGKAESQISALSPNGYIAPALGAIHYALAKIEELTK